MLCGVGKAPVWRPEKIKAGLTLGTYIDK